MIMKIYILSLLVLGAYLIGSIPFGYLFGKMKGIDLRKVGSGNIGATNTGRILGKKWAYICFLLDALKGFVPMMLGKLIIGVQPDKTEMWLWLAIGSAAICGHIFPVYLKFKGGKGVATSLGMLLGLWPYYTIPGIISFIVWAVFFLIWRYVSLASIVAAASLPAVLAGIIFANPDWKIEILWPLLLIAITLASLVIFRHRENIKRLLSGSENQMKKQDDKKE